MTRQLLTEALTGYRTFVVRPGGRIYSQYSDAEWPSFPNATFVASCEYDRYFGTVPASAYTTDPSRPGVLEYRPRTGTHSAPDRDCGCGIHACYSVGSIKAAALPWVEGEVVAGLIVGWGDVVPHPDGFRCSHARICALAGRSADVRMAAENCDVLRVDHRSELVEAAPSFGSSMPAHVVPTAEPGWTAFEIVRDLIHQGALCSHS